VKRLRPSRLCLLVWLATVTACSEASLPEFPGGPFSVALATDSHTQRTIIRVTGFSSDELGALRQNPSTWDGLVRASVVGANGIAISGTLRVTLDAVELVPQFSLDPGREYVVRVDGSRLPVPRPGGVTEARVTPARATGPPATRVTAIYPSSSTWPENILRFYLHFSAPMSGTSAIGHVRLVDENGTEIPEALLEVDVDLWNSEYTRRTVFFDPGRVKQGIKPNREMGRALVASRKYAIVVNTSWLDAKGQPLAQEFRHAFTAGPAVEAPLVPTAWSIAAPAQGTREPVVLRFPWALDEGLLQRALGVSDAAGRPLDGAIVVGTDQTSWSFTPASPWRAVQYSLVVLTLLEDPSGNKVGQAFEFERFKTPTAQEAERVTLPFRPR
jgi:hypothetical protein